MNFPVAPYTPAILRCPLDDDPVEAHSYVLNGYAAVRHIKAGSNDWGTKTVSEVILAGEKYSQNRDYFIERIKTLDDVFDWYHHGRTLFSNYLYFDGHVASASSADARAAIDPWADETP